MVVATLPRLATPQPVFKLLANYAQCRHRFLLNISSKQIMCQTTLLCHHKYPPQRPFADYKKGSFQTVNPVKGREIIQNVIEQKRDILRQKKLHLVKDLQETKTRVQEKVREKVGEVIERENIFTIPNFLTVGRGLLSPYLGYVIIQSDYKLAMVLLITAGITDLLDGQIARRWPQQASKFGSFIDPMADKLLIGSLVISMGYCDLLPIWLSGMILFRDAFLIGAGFVIRYISLPPPRTFTRYFDATHVTAQLEPTFISKVNTVVQLLTIGISLGAPIWMYADHPVLHGLWYITGATTVAAALSYILKKDTYKILKKPH
ncbi:probable cardiolipin synthase (CMP-forming) [Hermetia illucens]|nr:probable cardiolipin synthase (CMP-forming) [Hermetia illucens]XP_037913109.1 probable cardiolipin synthase (CMP-forming) [Hermetia illucens]